MRIRLAAYCAALGPSKCKKRTPLASCNRPTKVHYPGSVGETVLVLEHRRCQLDVVCKRYLLVLPGSSLHRAFQKRLGLEPWVHRVCIPIEIFVPIQNSPKIASVSRR
jgi:hypothetical protein